MIEGNRFFVQQILAKFRLIWPSASTDIAIMRRQFDFYNFIDFLQSFFDLIRSKSLSLGFLAKIGAPLARMCI